jgi:ABC-type multidrug transport system fused ATPase/permease subunit
MQHSKREEIYSERLVYFSNALKRQNRILGYIGLFRLLIAALALFFLVMAIRNDIGIFFLFTGLFAILFFSLVSYHKNQSDRRNLLRELTALNQTEQDCLEYRFGDNYAGKEYIDPVHPWSYDLDVFGEGSLFQFINRTSTSSGSNVLSKRLTEVPESHLEVVRRQKITRELAEKIDFRQLFTAHARQIDAAQERNEQLLDWVKKELYIQKYPWLFFVAIGISILSLFIIVAGVVNPSNFNFLLLVLIFNWLIMSPFIARTGRDHAQVSKRHAYLGTYAILLELIANEAFENEQLKHWAALSQKGSRAIKRLSGLLNLFDQRLNMLLGIVFNSLFLFDFIMLYFIGRWKLQHREHLEQWIETVGEVEADITLSGFAFNHPDYSYPEIEPGTGGMEATNMGHPLIPANKRINNSIRIQNEKVVLITGANMAGKSTFLRSVGINQVLGYAGCPVCATALTMDWYHLFSSMRTSDSLKDEESYFLAEIRRLKRIVEDMEKGKKMLILLDEVLKGTNTTDKQKGSRGLIEKGLQHSILCFIATHDLSLGEMEKEFPDEVVNYCFESQLSEEDVSFDYRIRPGIARNMNASFLMKKMGIMD